MLIKLIMLLSQYLYKDQQTLKRNVEHIYDNCVTQNRLMKKLLGIIDKLFFSDQRYNLGEVGRYRMNKKLGLGGKAKCLPRGIL
jgi:hypothetical protein